MTAFFIFSTFQKQKKITLVQGDFSLVAGDGFEPPTFGLDFAFASWRSPVLNLLGFELPTFVGLMLA